jgi:hypothetical protein
MALDPSHPLRALSHVPFREPEANTGSSRMTGYTEVGDQFGLSFRIADFSTGCS